jgi:hypothetical protein
MLRKEGLTMASRQLLEKLSGSSSDAQLRRRAQALLTQIGSMEEQMARYRAGATQASVWDHLVGSRYNRQTSCADSDPSSPLREALRKPGDGETQVQGILARIDCDARASSS